MRYLPLLILLLLAGCGSTPFMGYKFAFMHDRGSDWVLQDEREWYDSREPRFHLTAGLEWDGGYECYLEHVAVGYDWTAVACAKRFGQKEKGWYAQAALLHQFDGMSSWYLRTDEHRWAGHNPFIHLRVGYRYGWFRCPVFATGFSVEPFAKGKHLFNKPGHDLYWTNVECGVRIGGKTGMRFDR